MRTLPTKTADVLVEQLQPPLDLVTVFQKRELHKQNTQLSVSHGKKRQRNQHTSVSALVWMIPLFAIFFLVSLDRETE